jgi:hypothetical protein
LYRTPPTQLALELVGDPLDVNALQRQIQVVLLGGRIQPGARLLSQSASNRTGTAGSLGRPGMSRPDGRACDEEGEQHVRLSSLGIAR